jgi:histidine triad (HIT) family protein
MKDCIFCRIVAREIPAAIVHENDEAVVFRDAHPQAPVHLLVVPRRHLASLDEASVGDRALLGGLLLAVKEVAAKEGIAGAYRVVHNCGASAGQSVFHAHFHVLGGRALGWPPG